MKRYRWIVGCAVLTLLVLSGCRKDTARYEPPVNPSFTFPGHIAASFPKPKEEGAKALPNLDFHIDNRVMRIWNKVSLPYQSHYDSLDLDMKVTSEAVVRILNEETKKVAVYNPRKKLNRIDATGGKFRISIEIKGKPTLTYNMRIMTYGYNPDKFTWVKESTQLPIAAEEAKTFTLGDTQYWLARTSDGGSKLYSYTNTTFTEVAGVALPKMLLPTTLIVDSKGLVWVLDKAGALYKSRDLKSWTKHPVGSVVLTQLVGETNKLDNQLVFTAIGREGDTYASYEITASGIEKKGNVPSGFPVTEAFVYTYNYSGATSTTLFGGKTAKGDAAPKSFFLSGSDKWGVTPYQTADQPLPMSGGLYLRTGNDSEIFVIGGTYPKTGDSNSIKRSVDRGITWKVLPEQELPNGAFLARHHASGYATGSGNQLQVYIFGGIINGKPSQEIWHGLLDTTGGIINNWE